LRYDEPVIPPVRRKALRERERLDTADERALALEESPEERLLLCLELSDFARDVHDSASFGGGIGLCDDREQKARLYVLPLRVVGG
jgi:hypothetical protein